MSDQPAEWPAMQGVTVVRTRQLDARGSVRVAEGDRVEPDQIVVEGVTALLAGLRGQVVRVIPDRGVVIEGRATVVRGVAGVGRSAFGSLAFMPSNTTANLSAPFPTGAIVVVVGELTEDMMRRAIDGRASAIFAAGAHPRALESLTHIDSTALLDGSMRAPDDLPLSVVLAHGFGTRPLKNEIWQVLSAHIGQNALLIPTTDIDRDVHPEILIPLSNQTSPRLEVVESAIVPGVAVWVHGGEHDGASGRVARLFATAQAMPSGIRVRAARVRLDEGGDVTLPLANLQRVG